MSAAVQAAEAGNALGVAAGVLEVAAAGAAGVNTAQGGAANSALSLAGQFLNGAATATSIADAYNRGDIAGGLMGSLNGVLLAFSAIAGQAKGKPDKLEGDKKESYWTAGAYKLPTALNGVPTGELVTPLSTANIYAAVPTVYVVGANGAADTLPLAASRSVFAEILAWLAQAPSSLVSGAAVGLTVFLWPSSAGNAFTGTVTLTSGSLEWRLDGPSGELTVTTYDVDGNTIRTVRAYTDGVNYRTYTGEVIGTRLSDGSIVLTTQGNPGSDSDLTPPPVASPSTEATTPSGPPEEQPPSRAEREWEAEQELRNRSTPLRETNGPTRLFETDGGTEELTRRFDSFKPDNVRSIMTKDGPGRVGRLSDGRTIVERPGSRDGRPTLEIRRPNGRGEEYRFSP